MADTDKKGKNRRRKNENSGQRQEDNDNRTTTDAGNPVSSNPESLQESFERELHWCIQQVELSLPTTTADSKKGQDALKLLKVLRSSKAPMVKKRQVMRMNFGDYRKKMLEEEKKYAASAKKICLQSVDVDNKSKKNSFTYLKKASSQSANGNKHEESISSDISQVQNAFAFNFNIGEASSGKESVTGTLNGDAADLGNRTCGNDQPTTSVVNTGLNYYKMETGCNDFKFTFAIDES